MVAVYAFSVLAGAFALVLWLVVSSLAGREGSRMADPEGRYGRRGRSAVLAVLGFGLGGISASFAGWPVVVALVAALAGGTSLAVAGRWLGVEGGP